MNPQGTSFIPQRPSLGQSPKKVVRKVYVFTYLSYVFFFGTLLSVFGVLGYGYMLDNQLQEQKDKLVAEEALFNDTELETIKKFDIQLKTARERMDLHLSVLPIFTALEQTTSQLLTLKTFKYSRENDSAPKMDITGEASILNTLAFQREVLGTEPLFVGAEFAQVSVSSAPPKDEETGIVDASEYETVIPFSLSKTLDTTLLRYEPVVTPEDVATEETFVEEVGATDAPEETVTSEEDSN
jgi:hypothetical protein